MTGVLRTYGVMGGMIMCLFLIAGGFEIYDDIMMYIAGIAPIWIVLFTSWGVAILLIVMAHYIYRFVPDILAALIVIGGTAVSVILIVSCLFYYPLIKWGAYEQIYSFFSSMSSGGIAW